MQISETIRTLISEALAEMNLEVGDFVVEHPNELEHGDYASNVALVAAKAWQNPSNPSGQGNPRELAEELLRYIVNQENEYIEKVEIAGPGFINFYLSKKFYEDQLKEILENGKDWGRNEDQRGKKIMVEFTDPNPFKAFHIGHLMSNAIGESIARLIEFSGAEVQRVTYQGDVGPHVAAAIWGIQNGHGSVETAEGLGQAYAAGATAAKENENAKAEIDAINKAVYEGNDREINALYEKGRQVSLRHFDEIYEVLGTKFDDMFFESEVWYDGVEIIRKHIGDVYEESDGAVIFKGENYDKKLHTRVFINNKGLATYEAKEIGLAYKKVERADFDLNITITAHEQSEFFKVVMKSLEQFDPALRAKISQMSHGMMKLSSGKMSSRTGDVVTGESLINDVKASVLEVTKDRDIENQEQAATQIAIAAIKYSILRSHTGNDIIYDLEQSLSFEGDSGPYLQYAHTRALSILEKATGRPPRSTIENTGVISNLEKKLYRFPEVVVEAQNEYAPHHVTQYLTDLASEFNSFYASTKILDSENESYLLALTQAFQTTMVNGLYLLGIKTPEKM